MGKKKGRVGKMKNAETGIRIQVLKKIVDLAKYYNVSKVILFGSRARGDYREKSDIDLAVSGGDIVGFVLDVEEKTETLLQYDIVDMDKAQEELLMEIEKDGVILYEEV